MKFWLPIIVVGLICLWLMRDAFIGDPFIYLAYAKNLVEGRGLVLNQGEFSSGLTSPLWGLIMSICFVVPHPEHLMKIVGLGFLLLSIYVGRKYLPKNDMTDIGLVAMFGLCVINSIYGYETGLMLTVSFLLIAKKDWAAGLLPFARPEGIAISVLYVIYFRRWKALLWLTPITLYWLASWYLTGYLATSVVFRSSWVQDNPGMAPLILKRYAQIVLPFVVYFVSRFYERRGEIPSDRDRVVAHDPLGK